MPFEGDQSLKPAGGAFRDGLAQLRNDVDSSNRSMVNGHRQPSKQDQRLHHQTHLAAGFIDHLQGQDREKLLAQGKTFVEVSLVIEVIQSSHHDCRQSDGGILAEKARLLILMKQANTRP